MNNLVLILLLAAMSTLIWINRSAVAHEKRHSLDAMRLKLSHAKAALRSERETTLSIQERLAELNRTSRLVRQTLVGMSSAVESVIPPADPENEGAWPRDRAYFYLPKQFLGSLGYGAFHSDGSLSEEAAQLFGLNPAEKAKLTDMWRALRLDLEQMQLDHAERLTPAVPDSDEHREISFRLPALTNELSQVQQRFAQDLQKELGRTRGELIWGKVSGEAPLNGYPMGDEDRIVTFAATRQPDGSVRHSLSFTNPARNRAYDLGVQFDPETNQAVTTSGDNGAQNPAMGVKLPLSPDSALWNYRHLFGDQPLLQPRTQVP